MKFSALEIYIENLIDLLPRRESDRANRVVNIRYIGDRTVIGGHTNEEV